VLGVMQLHPTKTLATPGAYIVLVPDDGKTPEVFQLAWMPAPCIEGGGFARPEQGPSEARADSGGCRDGCRHDVNDPAVVRPGQPLPDGWRAMTAAEAYGEMLPIAGDPALIGDGSRDH
jgi:hypothetical protein